MRSHKVLVALLAAVLLLGACGGDDGTTTQSPDESGSGESDLTRVRVTTLNLCEEVYVYWGIEKGIFAEHDLEVERVQAGGGAAAVAAVVSDSADFAFSNPMTAMLSASQGFPIQVVSAGYETPKPPDPPSTAIAVQPDAPIDGPDDLAGKKVAVNELGGINQIIISAWLREADVDPQDVNFVALPFPELGPAVAEGRVDAAQVTPGIMSQLESAGDGRNIGDAFRELADGEIIYTVYLATSSFVENNPGVAEAFHDALAEIDEQINDSSNFDEQFRIAAEQCETPADVLSQLPRQEYTASVDMATLEDMGELMVQEGQLEEAPDLEALVPEYARS